MKSRRLGSPAFWPMLVRRIATVTISAPLASTAARVSAKSLYLPVPISRRDPYGLPAMTSGSRFSCGFIIELSAYQLSAACRPRTASTDQSLPLATAYGDHDFEAIALHQGLRGVAAARHDLAVALERNAFAYELQRGDEPGATERRFELAVLAIDGDRYHAGAAGQGQNGNCNFHALPGPWQPGSKTASGIGA